jgi:hypothetical protein
MTSKTVMTSKERHGKRRSESLPRRMRSGWRDVEAPRVVPQRACRLEAGARPASHVEETGPGRARRQTGEAPNEGSDEQGLHSGIGRVSALRAAAFPVLPAVQARGVALRRARREVAHRASFTVNDAIRRERDARPARRRLAAERARARFEAERSGRGHWSSPAVGYGGRPEYSFRSGVSSSTMMSR